MSQALASFPFPHCHCPIPILPVEAVGLQDVPVDILCDSLLQYSRRQSPDITSLVSVFKTLFTLSPSPPAPVIIRCVEDCAGRLFRESPPDVVQSFVKELLLKVSRGLVDSVGVHVYEYMCFQGVQPLSDETYSYAVSSVSSDRSVRCDLLFVCLVSLCHQLIVDD